MNQWTKKELIHQQKNALQTIDGISKERQIKGNANVSAGRYGELVANMVKFAESQMALEMLNQKNQNTSFTASLYQDPESQKLPSQQHIEPESLRGQNYINPT